MKRVAAALFVFILLISFTRGSIAADKTALDTAIDKTAAYVYQTVRSPQVSSVGGEWAVLGLARSGYGVSDLWYDGYLRAVTDYLEEHDGVLHDLKYSEYSRVILCLTAAGYDPRDVAGYDLTAPLESFDKVVWQGLNGPIWALIALDSRDYPSSRRDEYIAYILNRQSSDGGWNLSGSASGPASNRTSDPDITGMALQALAKYQNRQDVKTATDKAIGFLSKTQTANGGYISGSDENIESCIQVIVALCELGIAVDDTRFVKNGSTLIDYILSYKNDDGSFKHAADGSVDSQMSTEQALYALAAVKRAAEGKNSLYRMGDAGERLGLAPADLAGLPGKHSDVQKVPVVIPGKTFPDIKNHPNQAAIEALAERGIINGKSETSFDPGSTMTRAEFAAIVVRGLGLPKKFVSPFADVPAAAWYMDTVAAAYFYGIVTGASATTFNPGGTITRQEAAVMVSRAAKLCGMDTGRSDTEIRDTLAPFGDYRTVAAWARSSMAFCYSTGILDDDALDIKPTEAVKRCEIAEMLHSMLGRALLL